MDLQYFRRPLPGVLFRIRVSLKQALPVMPSFKGIDLFDTRVAAIDSLKDLYFIEKYPLQPHILSTLSCFFRMGVPARRYHSFQLNN